MADTCTPTQAQPTDAPAAPLLSHLRALIAECELANRMCIDQIGMGVIDLNAIQRAKLAAAVAAEDARLSLARRRTDAPVAEAPHVLQLTPPRLPEGQALTLDQLADAAACYALTAGAMPTELHDVFWPWTRAEWQPSQDARQNVLHAMSLLAHGVALPQIQAAQAASGVV